MPSPRVFLWGIDCQIDLVNLEELAGARIGLILYSPELKAHSLESSQFLIFVLKVLPSCRL